MSNANWMSKINDNPKLVDMVLPGSHDAGVYGDSLSTRGATVTSASTVSELAISPAAWPPMPSATTYTARSSNEPNASSLLRRLNPTSLRAGSMVARSTPARV